MEGSISPKPCGYPWWDKCAVEGASYAHGWFELWRNSRSRPSPYQSILLLVNSEGIRSKVVMETTMIRGEPYPESFSLLPAKKETVLDY
jgi:hypothetical protein